jgi:hypothetical protein
MVPSILARVWMGRIRSNQRHCGQSGSHKSCRGAQSGSSDPAEWRVLGDRDDDLGMEVEVNVKTESSPSPDAANEDPLLAEVTWNKNDG